MGVHKIADTRGMSREDWLAVRRRGIGGSDAAALVGLNEYASPFSVWADKRGMLPEQEETESLRLGRDLEDYVAHRFTERSGFKVRRVNAVLGCDEYPYALANIDREVLDGGRSGLECKTTKSVHASQYRHGEFPDRYYCQCVHYLAVTGKQRWYLAVLAMGEGFYIFRMTRVADEPMPEWCNGSVYVDDEEIDSLMAAETAFWEDHVQTGIPPAVDGEKATGKAVKALTGEILDEDAAELHCGAAMKNYCELNRQIDALKKLKDSCKQQVELELGGRRRGSSPGYTVTQVISEKDTFDTDRFRKDYPHMDIRGYLKHSRSVSLRIQEVKSK